MDKKSGNSPTTPEFRFPASPPTTTQFLCDTMENKTGYTHHDTPKKNKIKGVIKFNDQMGISYDKRDVFKTFNVSPTRGYAMLKPDASERRMHNDSNKPETRGRKGLITQDQINAMDHLLDTEGIAGRALSWQQLGMECGVDVNE